MTALSSRLLKGTVISLVLFIVTDMLWHNVLMGGFYAAQLAPVGGVVPQGFPVFIIVYDVIAAFGFTYFILMSGSKTWCDGLCKGAYLGFMMVGIINFVNHTLLPGWSLQLLMVDTAWGVVMGAITGKVLVVVDRMKKR